ncbi:MAG: hypothetical protein JRI23_33660, partial [Deltaproteobacteria bacterium]|nr:hypothetical protein [Deltaproteobacteria bacterium]MBW2537229.1 hypothetical protein [Deltaproteobacteria bacterium]
MPEYSGQVTHVELAWIPLWLIVVLPFLGAATNAVFGRRLQASAFGKDFAKRHHIGSFPVSAVAVSVMAASFTLAAIDVVQLALMHEPGHRYLFTHAWQMVRIGSVDINFAFAMDTLGAVMTLVVTGVGALIHVYATSYMADDPGYWRFFAYFNLFIFAMLLLVLGDNIIVMFFGWEGVGLCSYLLIGFWYKDYKKATCGSKAFIVNRIGDFGFICGIALLFWGLGGAWLDSPSQYKPDMRPRFLAVHAEAMAHGEQGAPQGADHGAAAVGHGAGFGLGKPAGPAKPEGPKAPPVKTQRELSAEAGTTGLLTMTTHPGAKVYFGITDWEQYEAERDKPPKDQLPNCATQPEWHGGQRPALSPTCYAVSPFVRKSIAAGAGSVHALAIVPGDGDVVVGTGREAT